MTLDGETLHVDHEGVVSGHSSELNLASEGEKHRSSRYLLSETSEASLAASSSSHARSPAALVRGPGSALSFALRGNTKLYSAGTEKEVTALSLLLTLAARPL